MKLASTLALALFVLAGSLNAEKKIIQPKGSNPNAPYSPAVLVDGTLFVSGTLGVDPKTRKTPEKFEDEVHAALDSIGEILKEAGMNYSDVVSVQVYLTDMDLFRQMNTVYTTYFKEQRPARTAVGVAKLASPTAHIEITVTAHH
ncbi:MAG TPA: RidA family protein [Bryobacteraceae bacterium]|nr:RidA family protein [Bryobacteraceae bacterium]